MSIFATVVVTKANQAAAQALTTSEHFIAEYKKGLTRYFVSSGFFSEEHYNALADSDITFAFSTDETERGTKTIADLGLSVVEKE